MNYHNTDVAACDNDNCPLRLECLRWWLGTIQDPSQVYGVFHPKDDECDNFVDLKPYGDFSTITTNEIKD